MVVGMICNPSTLEGEAGGWRSGIQGQSQLCRVGSQPDLRDLVSSNNKNNHRVIIL